MSFNLFPSIMERPQQIKFLEQEPDEHIELFLRQHWVTNVGWIFTALVGIILPFFLPLVTPYLDLSLLLDNAPQAGLAMFVLWYLFILVFILERYLFWYFNIYIVTNQHLVDIALQSLLSRNITEIRLDDVQSASSRISGIIRSLFNFGDVIIETAAESQDIRFLAVPRPDFVADKISDLQSQKEGDI